MTVERTHLTLRDLAAEIGQVLIYWRFLENEMRQHLIDTQRPANLSRGAIMSHWRVHTSGPPETAHVLLLSDVERVAAGRNLLAHAIQSATADPRKPGSPAVTCMMPDGTAHVLTVDAVRELTQDIDRIRLAIRRSRPSIIESGTSVTP